MIYSASLAESIDDKLHGYYPIKTREELDKIVAQVDTTNRVIIRSDFAETYFTPASLVNYISNVSLINTNVIIQLDENTEKYNVNDYFSKMLRCENIDELLSLVIHNEKQFFSCYHEVFTQVDELQSALVEAGSAIARQQEVNDSLSRKIEELEHQLKVERSNKQFVSSQLNTLVARINYQYNKGIDKSRMFYTDRNKFDKVLYIKETTRVQYVDSLIYYLSEIIKVIYNMPVRVLCIESYYAMDKVRLYSNFVPHYELKERDVISGNVLMLGVQPKLLEDILKNPSNISILIVLDRGGYQVPHVIGDNVEYFYTVSDKKDALEGLPDARIISYDKTTLNIPVIDKFDSLDPSVRMTKYSSLPIVKKLIEVIRG